jgi:hypothetical protein
MSIILADGFELGTPATTNKWPSTNGSLGSPGRYGIGNYLTIDGNGVYTDLGSNLASSVVSFAFRLPNNPYLLIVWYDVSNTSNYQLQVMITLDYIQIRTPNTILSTYYFSFSNVKWYWLSINTTINNTTGAVTVKLNDINIITLTGQNTRGTTSNNYANRVYIKSVNYYSSYIDDVIITDTLGSKYNDVLLEKTIKAYYPNADGTINDWTPSTGSRYTCVNETSTNNGDTNYISSSTAGNIQLFTMGDTNNVNNLDAVQISALAKKDDAAVRTLRTVLRTGSTNYEGVDQSLSSTYQAYTTIYETNPNTGSNWDQTSFNGIEAGVKVQS